jgi:hypothetical protein
VNDIHPSKRREHEAAERRRSEYLARGGVITRCPPPSYDAERIRLFVPEGKQGRQQTIDRDHRVRKAKREAPSLEREMGMR